MSATEVHSPSRDAAAGTADMNGMSQYTAPTRTIDAPNGTTYAYRRFGRKGAIPVVFLQHFRGNLDNWDPALVDDIAAGREVILADNSGVGRSTGAIPHSVKGLARDVLAFVDALDLTEIDLFGFSLGGFVAQETVLLRPHLVRRLILARHRPRGGRGFHAWSEEITSHAYKDVQGAEDVFLPGIRPDPDKPGQGQEVRRTDLHPGTGPRS
jgi:pimeloyl-ACP methyl ester carboxylesterase